VDEWTTAGREVVAGEGDDGWTERPAVTKVEKVEDKICKIVTSQKKL